MLLQSHTGEVHLLPALPVAWPEGAFRGIRVRGGFELDMTWKASRLQKVTQISTKGNHCKLRYLDKVIDLKTQPGQSYVLTAEQFEK